MLRLDWNILFNIINLIILYLLMKRFLFKPVNAILEKRQQAADAQFAEADRQRRRRVRSITMRWYRAQRMRKSGSLQMQDRKHLPSTDALSQKQRIRQTELSRRQRQMLRMRKLPLCSRLMQLSAIWS